LLRNVTMSQYTYSNISVHTFCMSRQREAQKRLGKRIRELRVSRSLTQQQLAELVNFDRTYIAMLEAGSRNAPFTTLFLISESLDLTLSEFFESV